MKAKQLVLMLKSIAFSPRKDILDDTKTSCFAVVTVNDTFPKSITQDDELIAKELNKIVIHL